MAVKKTQMYRRNLDGTETRLNPLTEAQYVSMDNGQTVQEVLSDRDSDKYTPVITNSSSTFKVGQGDSVDLSSSMKEGAYDSCVLKGRTLVNCVQEPSSQDVVLPYAFEDGQYVTINDTKESGALGVELKGQTLVNLINVKNATGGIAYTTKDLNLAYELPVGKYILLYDVIKANTSSGLGVPDRHTPIVTFNDNTKSYQGFEGFNTTSGKKYWLINATKPIVKVEYWLANLVEDGEVDNLRLFAYQDEMENWDIPYFEGMASCKMPILNSCQQLFDYSVITQPNVTTSFTNNGRNIRADFNASRDVHQNTSITLPIGTYKVSYMVRGGLNSISADGTLSSSKVGLAFDSNNLWSSGTAKRLEVSYANLSATEFTKKEATFTFTENQKVTIFYHGWNNNPVGWCEFKDIRIVPQGKSSILSLPDDLELRGIGDVKDTLDCMTGEKVERIGEIVLDGSEDERWTLHQIESYTTHTRFGFSLRDNSKPLGITHTELKCDRFAWINSDIETEHTKIDGGNARTIFIYIQNSRLTSQSIGGFKQWLQSNPITIQYQLETPVITKINLSSTLKSWNTTTHIYSEIPENSLYPILSHSNPSYPVILKPSTKYSIVANSYSNSHTNSAINFNLGGATASTTVGNRVTTITTPSTLTSEELVMSGRGNKLNNVMVIEGDVVGDEPYFEGICDCKSPILSNVGKNLFDSSVEIVTGYGINSDSGAEYGQSLHSCTGFLRMKPNTTYTIAQNHSDSWAFAYDSDKKYIGLIRANIKNGSNFTTPSNTHYIRLDFLSVDILEITNGVCIEENTDSTAYEPYKSNTTTFEQKDDKTIVLRSLPSGVCDTLNVETGEYVQRIGEVILDGSSDEDWSVLPYTPYENGTHYQFKYYLGNPIGGDLWQNAQAITSDTLPSQNYKLHWNGTGEYGIGGDVNYFMITWKKQSSPFTDVTTLRAWLSQNPTTIQYELETPIVSTIDMQGFPYAYTNGHVQLSSGHSGQSLTPTVEYSLSANKTGQINSNSKIVMKHQKQLDDFEAMMLTSMVQSAYDKAILQFDYEMQMMSLGGE